MFCILFRFQRKSTKIVNLSLRHGVELPISSSLLALNHICYQELYPDTSHIHAKTSRAIIPFLQVEGRASASWPSADLPTQDSEWKHSVQTTDYGTLCILSCSFLRRVPRVRSGLQIGLMVYSPAHQSKDR